MTPSSLRSVRFHRGRFTLEVGNALVASERKGYLEPADVASFLEDLEGLPRRVEHQPPERALGRVLDLARFHRLSTYDACYLELAERLALPLATLDERLKEVAKRVGIALMDAP